MNIYINLIKSISLENKYTKWYIQIIQNAFLRSHSTGYFEKHHIVPDCFFIDRKRPGSIGWINEESNHPSNLIHLTAKEHFIAHLLLTKMFEKGTNAHFRVIRSFHALSCQSSNQNRYITGNSYSVIKSELSEIVSNQMKGFKNAKCPLTGKSLGRIAVDDPRWANGKIIHMQIGFKQSEQTKIRRSEWNKNNPQCYAAFISKINAVDIETGLRVGTVFKDDPRFKTGEIKIWVTDKTTAKCAITGEKLKVFKNDPRWKTGEIVGVQKGETSFKKGTKILNNGTNIKYVKLENIPEHLNLGWSFGKINQ